MKFYKFTGPKGVTLTFLADVTIEHHARPERP